MQLINSSIGSNRAILRGRPYRCSNSSIISRTWSPFRSAVLVRGTHYRIHAESRRRCPFPPSPVPSSLVPQFPGSLVPQFPSSPLPQFPGSLVPWFPSSPLPWFPGSQVPWFPRSQVPSRRLASSGSTRSFRPIRLQEKLWAPSPDRFWHAWCPDVVASGRRPGREGTQSRSSNPLPQ